MIPALAPAPGSFPSGDMVVLLNRPLRPGTHPGRLSRFRDSRWDLSPGIFEEHMPAVGLDFETVPAEFLQAAKTYVWILLNTDDPVPLRHSGGSSRLSCLTISRVPSGLFPFFDFLIARQIPLLSRVTPADYDAYLAQIRGAELTLRLRESLIHEVRRLWSYRAQMPAEHALPDVPPWDNDETQLLVGMRPADIENSTRRIPEDTMRSLLLWSIRYVDEFSCDILPAWHEYRSLANWNLNRRKGPRPRPARQAGDLSPEVAGYLEQLRAEGGSLPGRTGTDGRLHADWAHLRRVFSCGQNAFYPGTPSRRLIDASGLPVEDGATLTAPVTAQLDGEPWLARRIKYHEAAGHARRLSAACLTVIAYLSGMRIGEVLSLQRGCLTHDPQADLWLIYGTSWKAVKASDGSKVPQGAVREDPWVVVPVVGRAIAVLEQLHEGPLLFPAVLDDGSRPPAESWVRAGAGRTTSRVSRDLNDFKQYVNDYCAARERNDPIPDESDGKLLSGSRFRRTLAWHIYRRPRGLVAGAIQYGHLRTQMFLGYAGSYASGFRDDAAMEEFLVKLEELADNAAQLDTGEHVSGPAAGSYAARVGDARDRFAGRVIHTTQAVHAMLANPSLQIFPAHGMTCVFDARKALCETLGHDDSRRTPALDDCRPSCGNIARTDRDIAVISADIDRLSKIAADPLSPPIRHRREAAPAA